MKLASLGPGLPDNDEVARFWNHVMLTDEEDRALDALKLVLGSNVARVAVAGDEKGSFGMDSQRVLVKLKDRARPVPLKSLGDGAVRLFGIALALADSRDGFLLVDEVENGIHSLRATRFLADGPASGAGQQRASHRDDARMGLRSRLRAGGHGAGRRRRRSGSTGEGG